MNIYRRLPGYDRPSELTGTDLALTNQDDLSLTQSGDLTTVSGADLIMQALMRRLHTPMGGYQRVIRSVDGLQVADESYGNRTYDYLSHPASPAILQDIEQALYAAIAAEERVEVLNVEVMQGQTLADVTANVSYRILSEGELRTLQVRINV